MFHSSSLKTVGFVPLSLYRLAVKGYTNWKHKSYFQIYKNEEENRSLHNINNYCEKNVFLEGLGEYLNTRYTVKITKMD